MNDYGVFYRQFDQDDFICYGNCSECDHLECEMLNDNDKEE